MELKRIKQVFSICRLPLTSRIDLEREFFFAARTDEELSLVCPADEVPDNALKRSDGWRAFRIEGELDFSLTGILARISEILAREKIGIFAVSTYNTDYILVRSENFERALSALEKEGYTVI